MRFVYTTDSTPTLCRCKGSPAIMVLGYRRRIAAAWFVDLVRYVCCGLMTSGRNIGVPASCSDDQAVEADVSRWTAAAGLAAPDQ